MHTWRSAELSACSSSFSRLCCVASAAVSCCSYQRILVAASGVTCTALTSASPVRGANSPPAARALLLVDGVLFLHKGVGSHTCQRRWKWCWTPAAVRIAVGYARWTTSSAGTNWMTMMESCIDQTVNVDVPCECFQLCYPSSLWCCPIRAVYINDRCPQLGSTDTSSAGVPCLQQQSM